MARMTKGEEALLLRQYITGTPERKAELLAEYPQLFDPEIMADPATQPKRPRTAQAAQDAPKDTEEQKWYERAELTRVVKRRIGLSLMLTLYVKGGTITMTTSELLDPRKVRDAIVSTCEIVPIMPSSRNWPQAVEELIKRAETVEEGNDADSRDEWMRGELAGFLGSGIDVAQSVSQRNAGFFSLISGSGATHAVYDQGGDGRESDRLYTHTKAFVAYLAKSNGGLRTQWDAIARDTLKMYFVEYRPPGKGDRGYWQTERAVLLEQHGIDVPLGNDIGSKG